ncbi:uncharacterized protein BDR25DRAFT_358277 [Lindgomyces ingoldianus]|uniref:Uncharacterized protein n=1 Tax=Lindgomyces ingoldianus TaxID=673940 RepID=A0ACB6QNB5_9PLEO|nr:uncharacterized protein BDR25DRAFT_358277 [Lindgomyces ingoldianus]KAF2468025.1 hypothetical protein BDR25DRAFT_358277 [Lindgomyces ingoldianus]
MCGIPTLSPSRYSKIIQEILSLGTIHLNNVLCRRRKKLFHFEFRLKQSHEIRQYQAVCDTSITLPPHPLKFQERLVEFPCVHLSAWNLTPTVTENILPQEVTERVAPNLTCDPSLAICQFQRTYLYQSYQRRISCLSTVRSNRLSEMNICPDSPSGPCTAAYDSTETFQADIWVLYEGFDWNTEELKRKLNERDETGEDKHDALDIWEGACNKRISTPSFSFATLQFFNTHYPYALLPNCCQKTHWMKLPNLSRLQLEMLYTPAWGNPRVGQLNLQDAWHFWWKIRYRNGVEMMAGHIDRIGICERSAPIIDASDSNNDRDLSKEASWLTQGLVTPTIIINDLQQLPCATHPFQHAPFHSYLYQNKFYEGSSNSTLCLLEHYNICYMSLIWVAQTWPTNGNMQQWAPMVHRGVQALVDSDLAWLRIGINMMNNQSY